MYSVIQNVLSVKLSSFPTFFLSFFLSFLLLSIYCLFRLPFFASFIVSLLMSPSIQPASQLLPTYLPTHTPTHLSLCLSVHPSIHPSIHLPILPPTHRSIYTTQTNALNVYTQKANGYQTADPFFIRQRCILSCFMLQNVYEYATQPVTVLNKAWSTPKCNCVVFGSETSRYTSNKTTVKLETFYLKKIRAGYPRCRDLDIFSGDTWFCARRWQLHRQAGRCQDIPKQTHVTHRCYRHFAYGEATHQWTWHTPYRRKIAWHLDTTFL
jgi:hypothetical protein